jgi:GT2 family glycosyltransferase
MVVWLAISSYRNDEKVLRILEQVHEWPTAIFERILIVDSEGTGVIPSILKDRGWSHVIYRSYDWNLGSGANLCKRLQIAAEGGADYAHAVNHDGHVDPIVVSCLLKAAGSIEKLGAAYPLCYFARAGRYNVTGVRELSLRAKLVDVLPRGPLLDVFWSSSNGALYSTHPTKHGIVPWEAMWMGWEDLEYGWRLTDHGYRQVIVCDAVLRDDYEYARTWVGWVSDKPAWRSYYHIRNLILAIRHSRNRPFYYAIAACKLFVECGLILLVRKNKWERLHLLFAGAADALRGAKGKKRPIGGRIL